MTLTGYANCLGGIILREARRWTNQRGRFVSALVRPLVWLAIFAAGFHFVLGCECLVLNLWNIMQISFLRRENISRQRHGKQTPRPGNMNIENIAPLAKHTDSSKSFI